MCAVLQETYSDAACVGYSVIRQNYIKKQAEKKKDGDGARLQRLGSSKNQRSTLSLERNLGNTEKAGI